MGIVMFFVVILSFISLAIAEGYQDKKTNENLLGLKNSVAAEKIHIKVPKFLILASIFFTILGIVLIVSYCVNNLSVFKELAAISLLVGITSFLVAYIMRLNIGENHEV